MHTPIGAEALAGCGGVAVALTAAVALTPTLAVAVAFAEAVALAAGAGALPGAGLPPDVDMLNGAVTSAGGAGKTVALL